MQLGILIGIVAFLLLLFIIVSQYLGGKDHTFLRAILIFIFLYLLILIAKDGLDTSADFCEIKLNHTHEEYVYGDNFTVNSPHWDAHSDAPTPNQITGVYLFDVNKTYEYTRVCFPNTNTTATTFYKQIMRLVVGFWLYVFVYISYVFLQFKGIIKTKKK